MTLKTATAIATTIAALATPGAALAAASFDGAEHTHGRCMYGFRPDPGSFGAAEDANGNGIVCRDGSTTTDDYPRR